MNRDGLATLAAKEAEMLEFKLDGFHNRMLDAWREIKSRVEYGPSMTKGEWIGHRYIKPRLTPGFALVERYPWRTTARKHAAEHGAAGVWHADDSLTLFYRDGDKVRTKRFSQARPAKEG